EAVPPRPLDRFADEPLVEAIRRRAQSGHRGERERTPRPRDREVEEAGRAAARAEADQEEGVLLFEAEQRVEGHHEPALGLVAAPLARDRLELAAKTGVELARMERPRCVSGPLEPVHRLPYLPDRPALEREALDLEDGLVAVVERVQPELAVPRHPRLGGSEHGDAPVALAGELQEAPEQPVAGRRSPHRIARD